MARGVPVVGVEVGDRLPRRGLERGVASGRDSAGDRVVDLDESEAFGELADHPGRGIGRSVVDDDDLEPAWFEVLVDATREAPADRGFGVLRGDDAADAWCGHWVLSQAGCGRGPPRPRIPGAGPARVLCTCELLCTSERS